MSAPRPQQTVWVTGAGGLIGSYLVAAKTRSRRREEADPREPKFDLPSHVGGYKGWEALEPRGLTREDIDLADFESMKSLFLKEQPQAVIHCAALSKTPACQADPALARKINVEGTARLAELAADIPFLFFSTDLVFDGKKGNYAETDPVNPLTVYAETKAEAERAVLENPKHTVIRTSLNGGISPAGDRGFNEELRRAWMAGKTLKLFVDEYRCPIAAKVTAQAIWQLLEREVSGIYHIAGAERLSRYQIGELLASRWRDVPPKLERGSLRDYQGPPRSPDTSLNCDKAQNVLSFQLPRFSEWLEGNPSEPF